LTREILVYLKCNILHRAWVEIRRDLYHLASLFIPCPLNFPYRLVERSLPRFLSEACSAVYCVRKSSLTLLERVLRSVSPSPLRCHKFRGLRRIICDARWRRVPRDDFSKASLARPRDWSRSPGINLNYKFHRTMA